MVLFRLGTIQESNWSAEIRETSRDRAWNTPFHSFIQGAKSQDQV